MSLAGGLIAGMLAACTSSSSNPGGGGASSDSGRVADATLGEGGWGGDGQAAPPTLAQCIAGVVSGPPPSECAPLVSCLEADVDASSPGCGADLIACFGADYAAGTVWGECQSFTSCAMQSSCTAAAGESCISQTSSTCAQCILGQLLTCARKSCSSPLGACVNGLLSGLSDAGAGDSSAADTAAVDSQAPDSQVPEGGTEASARDGSTE
jgi:hypothetical protein